MISRVKTGNAIFYFAINDLINYCMGWNTDSGILFGLFLSGFYSLCSAEIDISQRLQDFIAMTDAVSTSGKPTAEKANLIDAEYTKNFATGASTISDDELAAFFAATQYVMFYTLDKSKLPLFEQTFSRLVDTGQATPDQYKQLLQTYYALREFERANSLIEQYNPNSLQHIILANDLTGASARRTAWTFQEKHGLTRRLVDLQKGLHLVIIGSPYCGFAKKAISGIESDPTLAPLLREKVTLLAMHDFSFNYEVYTKWNQLHPSLPFILAHSREGPMTFPVKLDIGYAVRFYRPGVRSRAARAARVPA
ncbi:hypothetical protein F2P44_33815 [Massilia sp. CCM 8695]|uniref:DUF255 domain-containing protein n=2 Tax=Massilia frigida TaxID=2609281 RepID=A0ABX0NKQ1_9BURK|nr:hypothetical protein [Massilia frigida]